MKGFRVPKYSCSVCGKTFRREKQHFNHVMKNTCSDKGTSIIGLGRTKTLAEIQTAFPVEQQTTEYYGREYNFNPIPTGNRHLRSGLPLPRISKYRSQAI